MPVRPLVSELRIDFKWVSAHIYAHIYALNIFYALNIIYALLTA